MEMKLAGEGTLIDIVIPVIILICFSVVFL